MYCFKKKMLTEDSIELIKSLNKNIPESQINMLSNSKETFLQFFSYFKEINQIISKISFEDHIIADEQIKKKSDIPKNNDFNYIVKEIREYINEHASRKINFYFPDFFGRSISVFFVINDEDEYLNIIDYIKRIMFWLCFLTKHTQNEKCSRKLNIFIYLNDIIKKLPENKGECFERKNVNTGFTFTCIPDSEIVIFRKEEWFKVFLHETFHNFGLDFSDMDNENTKDFILSIFPVNSKVKLFEAYCDFWARTINCLLCSYFSCYNDKNGFISRTIACINYEIYFSLFQAVKNLDHMHMTYINLFSNDSKSEMKRKKYKEETSVLSYYIICSIFFNNFDNFVTWCKNNNGNTKNRMLIQFRNTVDNQMELCEYIRKEYLSKRMLENILFYENIFSNTKNIFLLKTLRKSICEF